MTNHPAIFTALAEPFLPSEVRTKPGGGGRAMRYITARHAMNRLDNVLGPENWWDEYTPNGNSVICRLTVRLPDGMTLTKSDAGGGAGLADAGDDDKSAFSDAFKRTAAKFGVARYLYGDGVAQLVPAAQICPATPALSPPPPRVGEGSGGGDSERSATLPLKPTRPASTQLPEIKTARELYRFASSNRLVTLLSDLGRQAGLPSRIVDWADGNARLVWEQYIEGLPGFGRNGTNG
jgi:hypothetical protein